MKERLINLVFRAVYANNPGLTREDITGGKGTQWIYATRGLIRYVLKNHLGLSVREVRDVIGSSASGKQIDEAHRKAMLNDDYATSYKAIISSFTTLSEGESPSRDFGLALIEIGTRMIKE